MIGAPLARSASKAGGSTRSISFGDIVREPPAMPNARSLGYRASCPAVGGFKNNTVGRPAFDNASITSVEPVKSSP